MGIEPLKMGIYCDLITECDAKWIDLAGISRDIIDIMRIYLLKMG